LCCKFSLLHTKIRENKLDYHGFEYKFTTLYKIKQLKKNLRKEKRKKVCIFVKPKLYFFILELEEGTLYPTTMAR